MGVVGVCSGCGEPQPLGVGPVSCPTCGGVLELEFDRDLTLPPDPTAPGLWRYLPWMAPGIDVVSLGEVLTPVVAVHWSGVPIRVKLEGLLPTGSFKDRGASAVIGFVAGRGASHVVEDSSGNAGAAIAAYATRAGLSCEIHAPATASSGKLVQATVHGAEVIRVPGPRRAAEDSAAARGRDPGVTYVPHAHHPYFLEGTRTFAYELADQCLDEWPDAVVMPVGAGTLFLGAYRGFVDLHAAGRIPHVPRMYAVQAAACDPIVRAVHGTEPAGDRPSASVAEGISIAAPVRGSEIVDAIRTSGGGAVDVEDWAIWEALRRVGRAGIFVEPTCAAALAGLDRLLDSGTITPRDRVLVALTGTGLKAAGHVDRHLRGERRSLGAA